MKLRCLLAVTLTSLVLALPAAGAASLSNQLTDPAAHTGEIPNSPDTDQRVGTTGWRSGVFMVGDSVTRSGLLAGLRPQRLGHRMGGPSVPGRDVSTLPYYLKDRVAAQHALPPVKHSRRWRRRHPRYKATPRLRYPLRTTIIAMGSNASAGWTYADLRGAVNSLPKSSVLVFVTPYRDPAVCPSPVRSEHARR